MSKVPKKLYLAISTVMVLSMVLAACAGSTATSTPALPQTGATQAPTQPAATQPPATQSSATQAATSQPSSPTQAATSAPTQPAATSAPTGGSTRQVKNPDTMIYATTGDPESLDPSWAYDTASGNVIFNVYETLLYYNKDSTTNFVPMLASSWDISKDGMTYTFHIRKGVKFQDGQDLTPQDVAYSFWRTMMMDRAGGPSWILLQPFFGLNVNSFDNDVVKTQFNGDFTKAVQAVENAVTYDNSAMTVTMHLKQPYGPMLQLLTGTWASIMSESWVVQQGGWNGDPSTAQKFHNPAANADPLFKVMNGTGPYSLTRWEPGNEIDLTANPNYWVTKPLWDGGPSGAPAIKNIVIKNVTEWGTRFSLFKTGDADIVYVPTQYDSQIDPLVKNTCDASGNCTVTNPSGSATLYKGLPSVEENTIYFNQNVNTTGGNDKLGSGKLDGNGIPANFFSDINIRKAFSYCFDYKTYIQQVWNGEATQAYGPIIQGELGYNADQAHYSYDPTKCADAFKASTLKSADGKSVWDTGFYVQYIYNTGNDQRKTAGDILAQDLLKVNPKFHLAVVGEPFALELSDQVAGRLPIFMLGWLEDYHDPQDWVVPYLSSGGTYAGSQGFAPDLQKQLDTLIQQGVSTSNTQDRQKIYEQLQNLSYENALDIFVDQPQSRVYLQDWVKGYYYNPAIGNTNFYFYSLSK